MRGIPQRVLDDLARLPVFKACSKRELEAVARIGTAIPVTPGYVLTRQGRVGHEFFIVLRGEASCAIDGREVARFGPGDFFGEMSLIDHQARSATVVAETDMEVIAIDVREFNAMLTTTPAAARAILSTLSLRLRDAQGAPVPQA